MAGSFTADIIATSLGHEWIGYVMATRNVAGVVAGVFFGRLSDRIGRYRCYLLSLSCEGMLALYCCFGDFQGESDDDQDLALILSLVAFMGVGNAASQTLLRSIQGDLFEAEVVGTALSAGSVSASSCTVLGYLAGPLLPLRTKARMLVVMWCMAGLGANLARAQKRN
jgi:MFS family permease